MEDPNKVAKLFLDTIQNNSKSFKDLEKTEFSVKTDSIYLTEINFSDLGIEEDVKETLFKIGYENPSKIQEKTMPLIINGKNVVFQSNAGTGKTLAFVASTIKKRVIIVNPTKELCTQTGSIVKAMGAHLNIKSFISSLAENTLLNQIMNKSNESTSAQTNTSNNKVKNEYPVDECSYIVTTPGTLNNYIKNAKIDIKSFDVIIVDEADMCFDTSAPIIMKLLKETENAQKIFFSASFSKESKKIIKKFVPNIEEQYDDETSTTGDRCFYTLECSRDNKIETIIELFDYIIIGQSIIFVRTKKMADALANKLQNQNYQASSLHSDIEIFAREKIVSDFRSGIITVLITTDVFSRGMDIPQVNLVINFDIPYVYETRCPDYETYQHRTGRSGRFGRRGFVIDVVTSEEDFNAMNSFQERFGFVSLILHIKALRNVFYDLDE